MSGDALSRAQALSGPVGLQTPDLFSLPKFTAQVVSERFPQMNGEIVMRFPTWGDELEVERLSFGRGPVARMWAYYHVCIEKAPASWFRSPGPGAPQNQLPLALDGLPDLDPITTVFRAYVEWRDRFRPGGE